MQWACAASPEVRLPACTIFTETLAPSLLQLPEQRHRLLPERALGKLRHDGLVGVARFLGFVLRLQDAALGNVGEGRGEGGRVARRHLFVVRERIVELALAREIGAEAR